MWLHASMPCWRHRPSVASTPAATPAARCLSHAQRPPNHSTAAAAAAAAASHTPLESGRPAWRRCKLAALLPQQPRRPRQVLIIAAAAPGADLPDALQGWDPYADLVQGKRFLCTECGKCCTGVGEVWVNEEECLTMARQLGLTPKHFMDKYTKSYSKRPGWRMLKRKQGSMDCVFLEGKLCGIYGARPLQCITYPFWPELMDPAAWVAERATMCEGISHEDAPLVDPQHAGHMLQLATEQLAALQEAAARARQRGGGSGEEVEQQGQQQQQRQRGD